MLKLGREAQLLLVIGLLLIIAYLIFSAKSDANSLGAVLADLVKNDQTKAVIVAVIVVLVVYMALVHAKIDDPVTIFAIAGGTGLIMLLALFYTDILDALSTGVSSIGTNVDKVKEALYQQYADPGKGEVYWPGNKNIQNYAKAAGYDIGAGFPFQEMDFLCIVHTDQIQKVLTRMPDPKEVWNYIYYVRLYPVKVYVNNQLYVVLCSCELKEVNITFFSTVTAPSGKTYDVNNEYRHMPKDDAIYVFNNPPWMTF